MATCYSFLAVELRQEDILRELMMRSGTPIKQPPITIAAPPPLHPSPGPNYFVPTLNSLFNMKVLMRAFLLYMNLPLFSGQPPLSGHYPFPRGWSFNWSWTVYSPFAWWFGLKYLCSTLSVTLQTLQTFQWHGCKPVKLSIGNHTVSSSIWN